MKGSDWPRFLWGPLRARLGQLRWPVSLEAWDGGSDARSGSMMGFTVGPKRT